jgi:hypothetical protein
VIRPVVDCRGRRSGGVRGLAMTQVIVVALALLAALCAAVGIVVRQLAPACSG